MDGVERTNVVQQLVEQHYELVYRFAYRLSGTKADAEDLAQHAFLTAHAKVDQLREPEKARSWLLTIVRNAFLKSRRAHDNVAFSALEHVPEPAAEELDAPVFDSEELQAALNELPEEFRSPVILFYFQQLSYREIADQLDVPMGTVMSRLARGKAFLRKRLAPPEAEPVTGIRPKSVRE